DETGIVKGINDVNPFRLSDDITNMISDACEPLISTDIQIKNIESKTILVIEVTPGKQRPYYLKSKGKDHSCFVRINGTSRLADSRRIKELEFEGNRISYDTVQEIGMELNLKKVNSLCRNMKKIALDNCINEEEKKK
ncbi:MAG: helix-turn-helix domain-containing protein, partial [Floccifex sp.]